MAVRSLALDAIKDLDMGIVSVAVDAEISRVVEDVKDRPGLQKVRSVILQLDVIPSQNDVGRALVQFQIRSKIPQRRTTVYPMTLAGENKLMFNPHAPEDPAQRTFDEVENEKGEDEV